MNETGHCWLLVQFLHLLPILWFFLKLVVVQNCLCRLLSSLFHHRFDPQVVDVEGSETDINGRIDSAVCGLSCCGSVSSSEVRLGKKSEQEAGDRGLGRINYYAGGLQRWQHAECELSHAQF